MARALVLLFVAACVLTACVQLTTSTPPPTTTATATPTTTTPPPAPDAFDAALSALAGDDSPTESALDVLWRDVMAVALRDDQGEYVPPSRLVSYASGEIPASPCAEGTSADFWSQNAFYCRTDASILYDEAWLREMAGRMGDYAPSAVIAHEWAHHVQDVMGIRGQPIQLELQADCMAGLFLANTLPADIDDPTRGLADLDAAMLTFFDLGNREYDASLWFQANEHGSQIQRMTAFATGASSSVDMPDQGPPLGRGLAWCYGYRHYEPGDFVELGPFRLLQPPRTRAEFDGDTFVLHPEEDLAYETSTVELTWVPGAMDAGLAFYPEIVQLLPDPYPIPRILPDADGYYIVVGEPATDGHGERGGALGLIVPRQADGMLLVYSYRDGPLEDTPEGFARLAESAIGIHEIAYRMCGDFQSGSPSDPNFNVICAPDQ